MSRLISDQRIISVECLDQTKSVLVDAHSLSTLALQLTKQSIPTLDSGDFFQQFGGLALANVIQTIVLYENVLVDSLLFEINSDVSTAVKLFPEVIRGVFLRESLRYRIGELVREVTQLTLSSDKPAGISEEDWNYWRQVDGSEIQIMDKMSEIAPTLIPPDYVNDEETIRYLDRAKPLHSIPTCCLDSMMTLGRTHFYLELARQLGIPLAADPARSKYFEVLLQKVKLAFEEGFPERVIARFENEFWVSDDSDDFDNLLDIDISIPAVAELALRYAKSRKISLQTAIMEIRESRNAVTFREWCAQFLALRAEGRPGAIEQRKMLNELNHVCEAWKRDVAEGINYQSRKLKLADIPLIGKVLKSVDMDEVVIKDPLLLPKKDFGYFLFLNDLLRGPTSRTA